MDTKNIYRYICLGTLLAVFSLMVSAQVTITGPSCVTSSILYQYNLTANWDSLKAIDICIQGGQVLDSGNFQSCIHKSGPVSFIQVKWDGSQLQPTITVRSTTEKDTLIATISLPLASGQIDTAAAYQLIKPNTIPATLTCSADTGGSCSPTYSYQWEQSSDGMLW